MKVGDEVGWKWGNGLATGTVTEIYSERSEIQSKGASIIRNGSKDDPAVVIKSDNGAKVLKLAHELQVIRKGSDVQ